MDTTPTSCGRCSAKSYPRASIADAVIKLVIMNKLKELIGETEQDAIEIATALGEDVEAGVAEVDSIGRKIVIRVSETGIFPSGSATLNDDFLPVLAVIECVLAGTAGQISVEGHTDNVPIRTRTFASNWAVSSARAMSVAHGLFDGGILRPGRFPVKGYADTQPLAANVSSTNRALNRRVEIIIQQGLDAEVTDQIEALKRIDPALYGEIRSEVETSFELEAHEVF